MEKFLWNDTYSVGNEDIDLQHQRLFSLFNALVEAIEGGKQQSAALQTLFRQLFGYVKSHFRFEEALMKSVEYPDFKEHKVGHEKIWDRLKEYRTNFHQIVDRERGAKAKEVAEFLQDWLQGHIKEEDQQYAPFLPVTAQQESLLFSKPEPLVMPLFHWNEDYSVNHPDIDAQHQRLFIICNSLIRFIAIGEDVRGAENAFLQLRGYVKNHFRFEEAQMKRAKYPDFAAHKAQHEKICVDLQQYRGQFNAAHGVDKAKIARDMAAYFSDWLRGHIKVIDKQYMPYVSEG